MFSLVGSVWFLSEVWLPGKDGVLVAKLDDSQDRKTVSGPKTKQ